MRDRYRERASRLLLKDDLAEHLVEALEDLGRGFPLPAAAAALPQHLAAHAHERLLGRRSVLQSCVEGGEVLCR